ncbi:MAG: ABC transporter substrate-binding protein [bacterium]|nr:ABC transporter substrate-binding protein [bacterium]
MKNIKLVLVILLSVTGIACGQSIKVGVVLPLTGALSEYGNGCLNGMRLAADELVMEDKHIILSVEDDSGNPTISASAVKKLFYGGCKIIVGPLTSSSVIAVARLIDSLNVPLIAPAATAPSVTLMSSRIYRLCYSDTMQGKGMAEFIRYAMGKTKAGVLMDYDNIYSKELASAFEKRFQEIGGEIAKEVIYTSGDTDFRTQLQALIVKNVDCIFVASYYKEAENIIKQASQLGITCPLMGGDGWDSQELIDVTKEYNGFYFYSAHFFKNDVAAKKFRNSYKNVTSIEPTSFGALGYDAIRLIGTLKLNDTTSAGIRDELRKVDNFNGVTGKMSFKSGRDPVKEVTILRFFKGNSSLQQKFIPK